MSKVEFKIVRKTGWDLNPDDNVVNSILRALDRNDGHCPCKTNDREGHDFCPCHDYLANGKCHCRLYVKLDEEKLV